MVLQIRERTDDDEAEGVGDARRAGHSVDDEDGDVIWKPAGMKHWHGPTATSQ
jgi:hypothetical protein